MQPNLDKSALMEAIMRRRQGGAAPALSQMTSPMGPSMQGGSSTPTAQQPSVQGTGRDMVQGRPVARGGMIQVDEQTRAMSKALMQKLMQFL